MNKTQDSIEILKLNVAAFPSSWNVYDGLGEAFMKNRNKELAIENYKKLLELNPKNSNAEEMLKKLTGKYRDAAGRAELADRSDVERSILTNLDGH